MNNIKVTVVCGMVLFATGLGVGRYLTPQNSTEIEKQKEETQTEKETTDRVTTNPDGTKTVEHIVKDTKKETKEKESLKIVESKKPDWKVSALVGYSFDKKNEVYGLDVQKRMLGAISIGVWGTTEKTAGLSIGYEF